MRKCIYCDAPTYGYDVCANCLARSQSAPATYNSGPNSPLPYAATPDPYAATPDPYAPGGTGGWPPPAASNSWPPPTPAGSNNAITGPSGGSGGHSGGGDFVGELIADYVATTITRQFFGMRLFLLAFLLNIVVFFLQLAANPQAGMAFVGALLPFLAIIALPLVMIGMMAGARNAGHLGCLGFMAMGRLFGGAAQHQNGAPAVIDAMQFRIREATGQERVCIVRGELPGALPSIGDWLAVSGRLHRHGHVEVSSINLLQSPTGPVLGRIVPTLTFGLRLRIFADYAGYVMAAVLVLSTLMSFWG